MPCCVPTILTGNSAISDIEYTASMQAMYGSLPSIKYYLLEDGNYRPAGDYLNVQFSGTRILTDMGGPARWMVKIG